LSLGQQSSRHAFSHGGSKHVARSTQGNASVGNSGRLCAGWTRGLASCIEARHGVKIC
jgi:hypothetical protein